MVICFLCVPRLVRGREGKRVGGVRWGKEGGREGEMKGGREGRREMGGGEKEKRGYKGRGEEGRGGEGKYHGI